MYRLTMLKTRVDEWQQLSSDAVGAQDLLELAAEEDDAAVITEVERDLDGLEEHVDRLEFQTLLSGEYAENGAIVSVHAGAGGTESQDWADMLLRMYIRWAEQHKFAVQILERSEGEEAGIKSATLQMRWIVCVRPLARRTRGAPAGAPIAIRLGSPAAHKLRAGGGITGDRSSRRCDHD